MVAAVHGRLDVLTVLAEAGVCIDAAPLMLGLACLYGNEDRVRESVAAGADVNAEVYLVAMPGSTIAFTPSQVAAMPLTEYVLLAQRPGAMTAAAVAASRGHRAILTVLAEAGSTDAPYELRIMGSRFAVARRTQLPPPNADEIAFVVLSRGASVVHDGRRTFNAPLPRRFFLSEYARLNRSFNIRFEAACNIPLPPGEGDDNL